VQIALLFTDNQLFDLHGLADQFDRISDPQLPKGLLEILGNLRQSAPGAYEKDRGIREKVAQPQASGGLGQQMAETRSDYPAIDAASGPVFGRCLHLAETNRP